MICGQKLLHPNVNRREAIQVGTVGLLGLGLNHLQQLRGGELGPAPTAKNVIFVFLSGGLAQHDSFDLKPEMPDEIRGEFKPISTQTPGLQICEHLPKLASISDKWALVRSLTHPYNEHSEGHMAMLTGRTEMPVGFNPSKPKPTDHPSIASIATQVTQPRNNLPPAIMLPETLIHRSGRVIPGQFSGVLGRKHDPFLLSCCRFNSQTYGAWPEYGFHHARGKENPENFAFRSPSISLPVDVSKDRLSTRSQLLRQVDRQRHGLAELGEAEVFDRFQQRALSMLTDGKMRNALDVANADERSLDQYGRHVFGWSLLMAARLVEAGVNLVQVNLGNNETWDTHGNAFPHLKNYLFPPMDQAVTAMLVDLDERGLLDSTLVVMAGEFGRTPKISHLAEHYAFPGRDHWGAVQTAFFAGGGVHGGLVVGASDRTGGYPEDAPQTPENMASTIYQALGLPRDSTWHDLADRPQAVYRGEPIKGLIG